MKRGSAALVFLLLPFCLLPALDWGLILDQTAGAEKVDTSIQTSGFVYSGTLIPWFSTPVGETGKLYLSLGTTVEYKNDTPAFIPELFRTELSWRFGTNKELRAGRMIYTDPLGFIASGFFDGARFTLDSGFGAIGIGLWYTGLIYKRNTKITMTDGDWESYGNDFKYDNFGNSYFSSRRLMAALDWDNPHITEWLRLRVALMGQFDLNGRDDLRHSQYLSVKALVPVRAFVFNLGGALDLAETGGGNSGQKFKTGLAGELGIAWMLPTSIADRLSFTGRFSSGSADDDKVFSAFVPVTTVSQGDILRANLSGLSMLRLDYTARPHDTITFGLANSYFILSDKVTYRGLPAGRDGNFLGTEFSGRLIWSPLSDLRLGLGGGVFLPSIGNADKKGDPLWRAELNVTLAVF